MFSIIPEEMRLNKLESRVIIPNKTLYLRARGLKVDSNYGKGGTADFTSRKLDKLVDSIKSVESSYYQNLKESQMPLDTDTSAPETEPDSSES